MKQVRDCGCLVHKKDTSTCADCGKVLCHRHIYQYVDGNNRAITQHAPKLCQACYLNFKQKRGIF